MNKFLLVAIGGGLGSVLRFWVGTYIGSRMGTRFPYGTLVINITASFLIGFIITFLADRADWSPNWRYLVPIGFIGGYSTFSTFEYESFRLLETGEFLYCGLNIGVSVMAGFIAVWLGVIAAKALS